MGNDDLSLVRAGADARRKYMDFLGTQWHPSYRTALFNYKQKGAENAQPSTQA